MTTIKPYHNYILVKEDEQKDTTTASGLVLTASAFDDTLKSGTVIEIGPGERNVMTGEYVPMDGLTVGMTVLYGRGSGTEVKDDDGQEYMFINYKHLLGFKSE